MRRAGRYLAVVWRSFLIPNLPYVIASPSAWFSGVFQPFTQQMVPAGQGLISLTLFAHLGGGSLTAYTAIMVLVALLVFAVYPGDLSAAAPGHVHAGIDRVLLCRAVADELSDLLHTGGAGGRGNHR